MQGEDSVTGYFPQGVWYDISNDSPVDASTAGRYVKLPAPLGHVPVHVLGGAIVPMQVLHPTAPRITRIYSLEPHIKYQAQTGSL